MTVHRIMKSTVIFLCVVSGICQATPYYGIPVGNFQTISNFVKGEVFVADSHRIFVKGFYYDGASEDAVFWAGSSSQPDISGFHVSIEGASNFQTIPASLNENILLILPYYANVESLQWLAVWDRNTSKSLGFLVFPKYMNVPRPMRIGSLVNTREGISTGEITIVDTQSFMIEDFTYDGTGKETYLWLSKGMKPSEDGIALIGNEGQTRLLTYKNSTLLMILPKDHFVKDYDTLSIWNKIDGDNYGFIDVPKNLNVPPSQYELDSTEPEMEDLNCEMLNDNLGLEIRWFIQGDDIIVHLAGNIDTNMYMALGFSKHIFETRFDSADAVVAGIDREGHGFVKDYFFHSNEECSNGHGMCPDYVYGSSNDLETLGAERKDNATVVMFKRRLIADDPTYDQSIFTDGPQAIVWAIGYILPDGLVSSPFLQSKGNLLLDFGRAPQWNCPAPRKEIKKHSSISWYEKTERIHCPGDHTFRAQLGTSPRSSVKKVWFINGIPTPELVVQRGTTYTFIVEGGLSPPYHHPLYITDSKNGGMLKNVLEANYEPEKTYAGIGQDLETNLIFPTAEGRLCDWSYLDEDPKFSVLIENQEVKSRLALKCEDGQPGKLIWTPAADTPSDVYYQSFTERNLGGKIHVVDFCEETSPHVYVEVNTKGSNSKGNPTSTKSRGLERETESSESAVFSHIEKESFSADEVEHHENVNEDDAYERMLKGNYNDDQHTSSDNVINSHRRSSGSIIQGENSAHNQQLPKSTTEFSRLEVTESPFPHDESERADMYVSLQTSLNKATNQVNINSPRNPEDLASKYPTHSMAEASSISAVGKLPTADFKPKFEGGFIPLVTNPMREKEIAQPKEFVQPVQHRRPHRPFLHNESVPFHDTFKPGDPDYSGFNISNYSQEDASIIVSQGSPIQIAASIPHPIRERFPPSNVMPLQMVQPLNNPYVPNPQMRPQNFDPRFQTQLHRQVSGITKNISPYAAIKNNKNFPIHNPNEDLAGLSSQRVHVTVQAAGEKKNSVPRPNFQQNVYPKLRPDVPPSSVYNGKSQFPQPQNFQINLPHSNNFNVKPQYPQGNKIMHPYPIQRRPDFYEQKELNLRLPNIPQRNLIPPRMPHSMNSYNQQQLSLPLLQSSGLQGQLYKYPKVPNSNIHLNNNFHMKNNQIRIPPGQPRHQLPPMERCKMPNIRCNMQIPPRENVPSIPLSSNGNSWPNPPLNENLKMEDTLINHPQALGEVVHLPIHALNEDKEAEESEESSILDRSSDKERTTLPLLPNAELVEVPSNTQNFPNDRSMLNPTLVTQNTLPYETSDPLAHSANFKNSQPTSTMNFHKNHPLTTKEISIKLGEIENPISDSKNTEYESSEIKSTDLKSGINEGSFAKNTNNNREQPAKEKAQMEIKSHESQKFHNLPAKFSYPEKDKYVLASSIEDNSSSNPPDVETSLLVDYDHDDQSDNSELILLHDEYSSQNVPFGTRLTFPLNGSKISMKPSNVTPKSYSGSYAPQANPLNNSKRVPGSFVRHTPSQRRTTSTSTTTTPITTTSIKTTSVPSTTEATIVVTASEAKFALSDEQNDSTDYEEKDKNLYYTPQLSSSDTTHINNASSSLSQAAASSSEVKHIPIIADPLEGITHTSYLGRKNILPNQSKAPVPSPVVPAKVSEDLNLPQISNNPPTHDNRTDYSILNHVLTLISGPSESKEHEILDP